MRRRVEGIWTVLGTPGVDRCNLEAEQLGTRPENPDQIPDTFHAYVGQMRDLVEGKDEADGAPSDRQALKHWRDQSFLIGGFCSSATRVFHDIEALEIG